MTDLPAELWQWEQFIVPEQVRNYIKHSLLAKSCTDGITYGEIKAKLVSIVREATEKGVLDDINWATFPLPETFLLEQLHRKNGLTFSLSSLAIKTPELPEFLYRVQLPSTATLHENGILEAPYRFTLIERSLLMECVKEALSSHLDWTCLHASPFISLFDKRLNAEKWAQRWGTRNLDQTCTLFQIDPTKLGDTQVFKTSTLAASLGVNTIQAARSGTEFLALHSIPRPAIKCLCGMTVYTLKSAVPPQSLLQPPSGLNYKLWRGINPSPIWNQPGMLEYNLEEDVKTSALEGHL